MRTIAGLCLLFLGIGSLLGFVSVAKESSNASFFHYAFSLVVFVLGIIILCFPRSKRLLQRFPEDSKEEYYRLIHQGIGWKESRKRRYEEWRWKQQLR
ncbi:MAG: hypothetical protein A2Y98_02760 [Candidatus Portnoybacteria bacterium RBG_19FT_COMBO_36_7]|uniref:Uncharacterized protein n=1 Tax=Candidatus Portnoybacteria bacterium RBG_19FT_COMBO_36_7 TaxID=1801992 RepID=A0A1G2F9L1_9BACT|nr:MAG: hypothetical protein A2Y98_02760 [Candidatus Portnoybacteria bacterium RBG_19FT_COMBO_36_7]